MERYIKVDELETIIKVTDWSNPAVPIVLYMIIDRCSTADVAPRSDVEALEKEIDRLKKILDYYALQYGTVKSQQQVIDRAKSEVAREILKELEKKAFTMHDDDSGEFILCMYCEDFEEIKQKYAEE